MKKLLLALLLFPALSTMAQNGRNNNSRYNKYNKYNKNNQKSDQQNAYKFPSKFTTAAGSIYSTGPLTTDRHYLSSDGAYFFVFQSDGNLVVYRASDISPHWSSNTTGLGATKASFQNDGTLVLTNSSNATIWGTGTPTAGATGYAVTENPTERKRRGSRNALVMQPDGNLVIYGKDGAVKWAAFR